MTVYLNNDPSLPKDSLEGFPTDLPAPGSDKEKAVTQLFKNTGTGKDDSYRKVVSGKLQFTDGGALKNKVDKIVILAVQLAVAFLFRVRTADEDEEE